MSSIAVTAHANFLIFTVVSPPVPTWCDNATLTYVAVIETPRMAS